MPRITEYASWLMLTLLIVFAFLGNQEFWNPSECQCICKDKMASITLVSWYRTVLLVQLEHLAYLIQMIFDEFDQKYIGIKVLDNCNEIVNNAWLNLLTFSPFKSKVKNWLFKHKSPYKVNNKMLNFWKTVISIAFFYCV